MPQCIAVTKTGNQCARNENNADTHLCTQHDRIQQPIPPEDLCSFRKRDGTQCPKRFDPENANHECRTHATARTKREETVRRRRIWQQNYMHVYRELHERGVPHGHPFQDGLRLAMAAIMQNPTQTIVQVVDQVMAQLPPVVPVPRLQAMSQDSQNIHTREVTEQSNKNMAIIMAYPIPPGQQTIAEIRAAWTRIYVRRPVDDRIYADMQFWWVKDECRVPGDKLYRRILRHLWAGIKSMEPVDVRLELIKRLQQECAESFQLCCDGHINRLLNVMVGFDDKFAPEVPKSVILQSKMGKISEIEDETARYQAATQLFAELNMGLEEAAPWLDALAAM
jgi:hypothetical protein